MSSAQHVTVKVKKLNDDAQVPAYARAGDAGLDLHSCDDRTLLPGEQQILKTGIAFAIPEGAVGLIWDRSGMAAKNGIKVMAGVIDHNYRGEVGVVLINLTHKPYEVKRGDRIAQMLIQPVFIADVHVVDELDETQRGIGAWGSSGR